MDLIYLDNNATTMPAPEVVAAMLPFFEHWYGNPSSVHRFGQRARQAIDEARGQVCGSIGCRESELIFTGGGTESINMAIRGLLAARSPRRKIIISAVEHPATRELCLQLAKEGAGIVEIQVDRGGAPDMDQLSAAVDDQTALVSIMLANNETGVLFPVEQIAGICSQRGVPLHTDATQAIGKIAVDVKALGVDAMSFAAHKFHGPKGVGGLYLRRGLRIRPLLIGGPQEQSRRGGTENVPGIVGMGKAAELISAECKVLSAESEERRSEEVPPLSTQHSVLSPRVAALRDRFEGAILKEIPDTHVNGRTDQRLPNTTNIGFARLEAEAILLLLSEAGVCASAGSACSSGSLEPSHVLRAMKIPDPIARGAVRFSLSRYTTEQEVSRTLELLPGIIQRLRQVLPVGR